MNETYHNGNMAADFMYQANRFPNKLALKIPVMDKQDYLSEESCTYAELLNLVNRYQQLWRSKGWKATDRVIIILKPSQHLYAIALSMTAIGIIPVFIDTGMGRKKIQMAIQDANAKAIISFSALIKLFWFIPSLWRLERLAVDNPGIGYGCILQQLALKTTAVPICIARNNTDHGLITFTSGSTGRPKGADRTHCSLVNQHRAISLLEGDGENAIDSPCFPMIVLHNLSCGMSTIIPKVDFADPAGVNAGIVIEQLKQADVTQISGAPAYISKLVDWLLSHNQSMTDIGQVVVGGATVPVELAKRILQAFPNAHGIIIYGSTEAEPISTIDMKTYITDHNHADGYLVGMPHEFCDVLIADVSDDCCHESSLGLGIKKQGQVGEILVSGEHVLQQYLDNPSANRENKIPRNNGLVWHRTGDTGLLDRQGRLWLTGRVKDIIYVNNESLQAYPIERALDALKDVTRAALISHESRVYLFLQLKTEINIGLQEQIQQILRQSGIQLVLSLVLPKIPVDGRHNSKIDRPMLREHILSRKTSNAETWSC
ncbi:AMP-binding protein [Moritella sp. 28]|uniref:AMP-binding protein n=1 Tax=Moritella sp. 28 TaxID=2746232 RepID=UPI001BA58426|nr:AMP-binding protein [Moritella sp. 28]QUM85602.1 AMP-binding protein [Moritella sp. 28]